MKSLKSYNKDIFQPAECRLIKIYDFFSGGLNVTSSQSLPVFCGRLKTRLFSHSFRWLYCCACKVTLSLRTH